jgi:hypothetical protein
MEMKRTRHWILKERLHTEEARHELMRVRQDYKDRCTQPPNIVDNPDLLMPLWYWVASAIISMVTLWGIA